MNRKHLTLSLIAVALLVMIAAPVAASGGVRVSLTPDRSELAVGDPVQLTLEVQHPAGQQVIIPKLEQAWGDFEVRGQSQATTTPNDDGTETTRQTIEVTLFNLGDFETPALPLTLHDGSGQLTEEMVPSVSLRVNPTLAEDDTTLRDIKPQAPLAMPPVWTWIAGSLLLVAVLTLGGYVAYRRLRGEPLLPAAVDNRLPWQVAYDELARIEGLGLLEQGRFKEYYSLVTDCLRTYLEVQFDLRVFDRTTSQLRVVLRRSDLAADHTQRLLDLFMESDLVKFAKFTPDLETARQLTGEARQLVDLTRPEAESELESLLTDEQPPRPPVAASQLSYQSGQ